MGVNIFGPFGPGINETTDRIAQDASGSSADTWFGPCIGNDNNTGTKISYRWLNFITANLRRAVRGMGVTENETDDDMLLKAIQAAQTNLSVLLNLPIFPEVQTTDGTFSFTSSAGQIVIGTAINFLHRGHKLYSTTADFVASELTFATVANKTYHLRWYPPGSTNAPAITYPKGRFMLRDLADAAYNPSSLAETDASFDTKYDDMILARVVTNASNALTITALANKAVLKKAYRENAVAVTSFTSDNRAQRNAVIAINWSRTPEATASMSWADTGNVVAAPDSWDATKPQDHDEQCIFSTLNRYGGTVLILRDYSYNLGCNALFVA